MLRYLYDSGALQIFGLLAGLFCSLMWQWSRRRKEETQRLQSIRPQRLHDVSRFDQEPDAHAPQYLFPARIVAPDDYTRYPPQVAAMLWSACEMRPSELLLYAVALLEQGHDGPALRRLAAESLTPTTVRSELEPAAKAAFAELGTQVLPAEEATLAIARWLALEHCEGRMSAGDALARITLLYNWSYEGPAKQLMLLSDDFEYDLDHTGPRFTREARAKEACSAFSRGA